VLRNVDAIESAEGCRWEAGEQGVRLIMDERTQHIQVRLK